MIITKLWALRCRQKRWYACIVRSEALNTLSQCECYLERGAEMEVQDTRSGRQQTAKECEVHDDLFYLPIYFLVLGDGINRDKDIISQASGTEGVPAYLYKQSNRLALTDKTR